MSMRASDLKGYSYFVLRYVHDPVAGETVNVGVLLHADGFLRARVRGTVGRLRKLFPDLRGDAFKSALRAVERGAEALSRDLAPLLPSTAADLARRVLPDDDSGLRWSTVGSGLTSDPEATLGILFHRLVTIHDRPSDKRRDDEDVWRPIRDKLSAFQVEHCFEEHTVWGQTDAITLRHAWKNGKWHAVEPVSLDFADAGGVKEKARRWLGHLSAVEGLDEQAIVHLIVGQPTDESLAPAYRDALAILRKAPAVDVVEEVNVDAVVMQLADQIADHEAAAATVQTAAYSGQS